MQRIKDLPKKPFIPELLIAITGAVLFMPFLGGVHLFDWDEINFAESAREMILTGDYLTVRIDFQPFWEKPPLFIWFQVLSMKIFGINEFAARFPNSICGIISLLFLYRTGKKVYDSAFGLLWVMVYTGSILPFFYFKSGIIDPWFNLFIFSGLVNFIFLIYEDRPEVRWIRVVVSAILIGLAILTKGPVAVLVTGLTIFVYLVISKFRMKIKVLEILVFIFLMTLVGGIWFVIQAIIGNFQVIADFMTYQVRLFRTTDAGHGGFFLYHIVILFFGVYPASVYALKGFKWNYYDEPFHKKFKYWMIILFSVVLVIFSIVRTKIVHYSSLCYFPLTFMGTYVLIKIIQERIRNYRWLNAVYAGLGIFYGIIIAALPFLLKNKELIISRGWIKDEFAIGSLQADVHWPVVQPFIILIFVAGIVISLWLIGRRKEIGYRVLLINTTLFVLLQILLLTPVVEKYSQRALIEFCMERQKEDCYIHTLGMKSYAHLFYSNKQLPGNPQSFDKNWLLIGKIDKPVYFITRNRSVQRIMNEYPHLKLFYEKNGYAFLKREPENQVDPDL